MGRKQKLCAYSFFYIFPNHDWFVCLRFSLISISATLFKSTNRYSTSVLKDLRKLMDLSRVTGENVCVLFDA